MPISKAKEGKLIKLATALLLIKLIEFFVIVEEKLLIFE